MTAAGRSIPPSKPILGDSAFRHESGIHCAGLEKDRLAYQPFDPARVGQSENGIVLGKHSGQASVRAALLNAGLDPSGFDLDALLARIHRYSRRYKRAVSREQLLEWSREEVAPSPRAASAALSV